MEKKKSFSESVSDYILEDTEQTKRMKEFALRRCYTNSGEMYKLLDFKVLHDLVVKIKKGSIKLSSNLVYGTDKITREEKFLENLDRYISFVRDNYHIESWEMLIIIELTLNSKYSDILFCDDDFHSEKNYKKYQDAFIRIFIDNLYSNAYFLETLVEDDTNIIKFTKKFKDYNLKDSEELREIDFVIKKIIDRRKNNLFNSFVPYKEYNEKNLKFYAHQVDWVLGEYFDYRTVYDVLRSDNKIIVKDNTEFTFEILTDVDKAQEDDHIEVYYRIRNDFISFDNKAELFRKSELLELLDTLEEFETQSYNMDKEITFIDANMKIYLWICDNMRDIEFTFDLRNDDLSLEDKYILVISDERVSDFRKLIENQI